MVNSHPRKYKIFVICHTLLLYNGHKLPETQVSAEENFLRRKPHSRVWGRHSPTRFPRGKMSAEANFGTVVESCSMKPTLSPSSFPFASYTTEKCKIAKLPAIFLLPLTRTWRAFAKRGEEFSFRIRNTGGTILATAEIKKAANLFERLTAS